MTSQIQIIKILTLKVTKRKYFRNENFTRSERKKREFILKNYFALKKKLRY